MITLCQKKPEDKSLWDKARKETMSLIYFFPQYYNIIPPTLCSAFLLYCNASIDTYIAKYNQDNQSFEVFIANIIRRRASFFLLRCHSLDDRDTYMCSCPEITDGTLARDQEPNYGISTEFPKISFEQMPKTFTRLCELNPPKKNFSNEKLNKLARQLGNKRNRKGFLLLVTVNPHLMLTYYLGELTILLGVDKRLLGGYLSTAQSLLSENRIEEQKLKELANSHFNRIVECQIKELSLLEDEYLEREKILYKEKINQKAFKTKIESIRRQPYHLSHTQIGSLVCIARGTVNSSIYYAKQMIQSCMDA